MDFNRTMDTAPRDGELFLVVEREGVSPVAAFRGLKGCDIYGDAGGSGVAHMLAGDGVEKMCAEIEDLEKKIDDPDDTSPGWFVDGLTPLRKGGSE